MSKLPVYVTEKREHRRFFPNYFRQMFHLMGAGDYLKLTEPGAEPGTGYLLNLGNTYRASKNMAAIKGGNMCVFDAVEPDAWAAIEKNDGFLFFELTIEGFFPRPEVVVDFYLELAERGVDPSRVAINSCNLLGPATFERVRRQLYLPEGPRITALNGCYWMVKGHNRCTPEKMAELQARAAAAQAARLAPRPYKYVSFNGRGREHRYYVLLWLIANGYLEDGLVSFLGYAQSASDEPDPSVDIVIRIVARFPDAEALHPMIPKMLAMLPLTIDITREDSQANQAYKAIYPWISQDYRVYDQCYFSLVLDTSVDKDVLFITPIAYKSFMNFVPFVYVGNAGCLQEMRRLGFRTFAPWIDESYDRELDQGVRLTMALAEMKKLMSKSKAELHEIYDEMWSVLDHNYWHLHSADNSKFIEDVETNVFGPARAPP